MLGSSGAPTTRITALHLSGPFLRTGGAVLLLCVNAMGGNVLAAVESIALFQGVF